MSAREFELCRSRPRQGRVPISDAGFSAGGRNFRIGFYRIRLRFDQPAIDYQLLIRQFDARRLALAVPPAPARAGRRGSGGNAHTRMPRRARVPAPATRPFAVRRVSRVPRRIRNRAEENKGRERPRDRSKRPDPLGCQATRHSRTRPSRPRLDTHQARRRSASTDHGSISNTSGAWRPIALGESQPNLADMPSDSIEVITSNKFRLICW